MAFIWIAEADTEKEVLDAATKAGFEVQVASGSIVVPMGSGLTLIPMARDLKGMLVPELCYNCLARTKFSEGIQADGTRYALFECSECGAVEQRRRWQPQTE